jgi:hypothetical protein
MGSIFWTQDGSHDTLVVVASGSLYVAMTEHGELSLAHDMLRSGREPERVLPKSRLRILQGQLQQVRHQRNDQYLKLCFVDDEQKSRSWECSIGSRQRAAEAARTIATAMGLSEIPREETASVAEITLVPAIAAAMPLAMLGGMYLVATGVICDAPDAPQNVEAPWLGKGAFLAKMTERLGPNGVLALIGGVLLTTFSYWFFRFVNRPAVDVYRPGVR